MKDSDKNALLNVWKTEIDRVGYLDDGSQETEVLVMATASGGVMEASTIGGESLPFNKEFSSGDAVFSIVLYSSSIGTTYTSDIIASASPTGGTATASQDFALKISELSLTIDE